MTDVISIDNDVTKRFALFVTTFTLASVGSTISNSAVMLVCFRILQGIGAAAIYTIGAAILTPPWVEKYFSCKCA